MIFHILRRSFRPINERAPSIYFNSTVFFNNERQINRLKRLNKPKRSGNYYIYIFKILKKSTTVHFNREVFILLLLFSKFSANISRIYLV